MQLFHDAVPLPIPPATWCGRAWLNGPGSIPVLSGLTDEGPGGSAPYAAADQHPNRRDWLRPG